MGDWIFCDLDGTLLRNDKSLSAFSVATLQAIRAQGHRLVFATARPLRAVRRLLPQTFHGEWFLCGNGARGVFQGRLLWDEVFEPALVSDLTSRLAEVPGLVLGLEALDSLTVSGEPWYHSQGDVFTVDPGLVGRSTPANKILVTGEPRLLDRAEALLPAQVSRIRTDAGTLLQIMPAGIDKGAGVRRLLSSQGEDSSLTVGCGDDHNDIPLFRAVSVAVAPANAVAELKALAQFVTPGTNDDDAIAGFLADRYLGDKGDRFWANRRAQNAAKSVLEAVAGMIHRGSTEASIVADCVRLLQGQGIVETWYHEVPALVLAGSRSCLSVSGRDYRPAHEPLGDNNLVTIDLSPLWNGAWGDCARSFPLGSDPEWQAGMEAQRLLHQDLVRIATPTMTFDQLYLRMNQRIQDLGYENLDFLGNLGHSIAAALTDRVFIERGNPCLLGSGLFTFEPHIRRLGGVWGFKHENIYWFDATGALQEL